VRSLIERLPKVELHLHIEGTLEPSLMLELAERNQVPLPYKNLAEVKAAYQFEDLQSFLDLYYLGASVLVTEADFYELMMQYLTKASQDHIVHCEVMFDPQTHLARGIGFEIFMPGFQRAIADAEQKFGISTYLIMCFLRDLPEAEAIDTLLLAAPFKDQITAIGLDSAEMGHPPSKFQRAFAEAAREGYQLVAHAGEEGGPEMIKDALDTLKVVRIDHGVQCIQDSDLRLRLAQARVPLTVCPLSNIKLCVFADMAAHPLLSLLSQGLNVTVNSDDPAYFGGYLVDNFWAVYQAHHFTEEQFRQLLDNAIKSSFLPDARKNQLIDQIW